MPTSSAPPHILLIDDHAMFRAGLNMVIGSAMPRVKIFEAATIADALSLPVKGIDLVLLDIKLDGVSGLEGISLLKQSWPTTPILMLSSMDEPQTERLAITRGAVGFMSKAETAEKIIEAVTSLLVSSFPKLATSQGRAADRHLTPRQCDVMDLLHRGLSNKLIARELDLSSNTVRRHVQDILEFFGVVSRAEAVSAARAQGLVG